MSNQARSTLPPSPRYSSKGCDLDLNVLPTVRQLINDPHQPPLKSWGLPWLGKAILRRRDERIAGADGPALDRRQSRSKAAARAPRRKGGVERRPASGRRPARGVQGRRGDFAGKRVWMRRHATRSSARPGILSGTRLPWQHQLVNRVRGPSLRRRVEDMNWNCAVPRAIVWTLRSGRPWIACTGRVPMSLFVFSVCATGPTPSF
jgi:hypothetical protein